MPEYDDSFPRPVPQMVLAQDPSQNVKDSLQAAIARFDALREADQGISDALRDADLRTLDAEMRRIKELMEMRSSYTEKLEVAEAKRIDAIRLVDTNAVAIANQRATEQAAVLAAQVAASAETLRILVQQTAAAAKAQLDQTTQQLSDRISVVERFQYEGRGSAGNISPALADQLAQLGAAVAALKERSDRGEGKAGLSTPILMLITGSVVGLIVFILQSLIGS